MQGRRPRHAPRIMSRQDVLRALGASEYVVNEPLPPGPGGIQMESFGAIDCTCDECIADLAGELGICDERERAGQQNPQAPAGDRLQGARIEEVGKDEGGGAQASMQCAACQSRGEVRLCTGCRQIAYCSPECQRRDWKAHKLACGSFPVLEYCEDCRQVKYCSEECEEADKENHRALCQREKSKIAEEKDNHASAPQRQVYVPRDAMDKCFHCGSAKREAWRLCPCGEVWYCSVACSKEFWKTHKAFCGETERIDISKLYPLLACLVDISHDHPLKPIHKAATLTVQNNPTPGSNPMEFPDGWEALPVVLGAPTRRAQRPYRFDRKWWPGEPKDNIRAKLASRIRCEGFVLPILTSVCLALLSEMYTTTSGADSAQRRLRLRYRTMPIVDFGICAGSARVVNQDKLGYIDGRTLSMLRGQDPDEHYWFYFRTPRGEELILDCAMFTFNLNMFVFTRPYGTAADTFVPAFFQEREMRQNAPSLHTELKRMSMFRSPEMQRVAVNSARGFTRKDEERVAGFMASLAGREMTSVERELAMALAHDHTQVMRRILREELWKQYPEDVQILIGGDPGEMDNWESRCDAWWNNLQKEKRKKRQAARREKADASAS